MDVLPAFISRLTIPSVNIAVNKSARKARYSISVGPQCWKEPVSLGSLAVRAGRPPLSSARCLYFPFPTISPDPPDPPTSLPIQLYGFFCLFVFVFCLSKRQKKEVTKPSQKQKTQMRQKITKHGKMKESTKNPIEFVLLANCF